MVMINEISKLSPAKINLYLEIINKRMMDSIILRV